MEKRCSVPFMFTILILMCLAEKISMNKQVPGPDFYNFFATDLYENIVSFEKYRGTVTLVVNVASECGYTDNHYRSLNTLVKLFQKTQKFNVLAFPCNQFGNQEPGTLSEIQNFAYSRMGALFPLFSKVDVRGEHVNEAWSFLIEQTGKTPNWNFWKYLVDHNGQVSGAWGPTVGPDELYQVIQDHIADIDRPSEEGVKKEETKKISEWENKETNSLEDSSEEWIDREEL